MGTVAFLQAIIAPSRLRVLENLRLYLGRLQLIDPDSARVRREATVSLGDASTRYVQIPLGTVDYLAYCYRIARRLPRTPPTSPVNVFPFSPQPAWFEVLSADEQRFIISCQEPFVEPAADVMYMHFYARLNVEQIVAAAQIPDPQRGDTIVRRLEDCWDVILS